MIRQRLATEVVEKCGETIDGDTRLGYTIDYYSIIGADFLSIFVLNIPRIFFNIAIFFLENFNLALHYN